MRQSFIHIRPLQLALPLILLLCWAVPLAAKEVPPLQGRVNDLAAMLSPATIQQLENSLSHFENTESTQIVVLTIDSLDGEALEEFSLRVAEQWRIGQQGLDNGALLLIAKNERKIRIEVGYGLEGRLTDLLAGRIIRDVITPQFKQGNFDQGVLNGITAMMGAVRGEFSADSLPASQQRSTGDQGGVLPFLLFGIFIVGKMFGHNKILAATIGAFLSPVLGLLFLGLNWPVLLALIPIGAIAGLVFSAFAGIQTSGGHRRTSGTYWGGGFGGSGGGFGGGFSGGGGGFGGGGASGGW